MKIIQSFLIIILMRLILSESGNVRYWKILQQFAHHVTIVAKKPNGTYYCSGSIIDSNWILTTMTCVDNSTKYTIDFNRKFKNESYFIHSSLFSIILDSSSTIIYPTRSITDNIALLKLPMKLDITERPGFYVRPIMLCAETYPFKELAILPAYVADKHTLLNVKFKKSNNWNRSNIDTEFVAKPIDDTRLSCADNEGAGLIINWRTDFQRLVGILTYSANCENDNALTFMDICKYVKWIRHNIAYL